jgi:hypothetical protein
MAEPSLMPGVIEFDAERGRVTVLERLRDARISGCVSTPARTKRASSSLTATCSTASRAILAFKSSVCTMPTKKNARRSIYSPHPSLDYARQRRRQDEGQHRPHAGGHGRAGEEGAKEESAGASG